MLLEKIFEHFQYGLMFQSVVLNNIIENIEKNVEKILKIPDGLLDLLKILTSWPVILLFCLIVFRTPITRLLEGLSKFIEETDEIKLANFAATRTSKLKEHVGTANEKASSAIEFTEKLSPDLDDTIEKYLKDKKIIDIEEYRRSSAPPDNDENKD